MSAQLRQTEDGHWLISCVTCDLLPSDATATDYAAAVHRAHAHDAEFHLGLDFARALHACHTIVDPVPVGFGTGAARIPAAAVPTHHEAAQALIYGATR